MTSLFWHQFFDTSHMVLASDSTYLMVLSPTLLPPLQIRCQLQGLGGTPTSDWPVINSAIPMTPSDLILTEFTKTAILWIISFYYKGCTEDTVWNGLIHTASVPSSHGFGAHHPARTSVCLPTRKLHKPRVFTGFRRQARLNHWPRDWTPNPGLFLSVA